jgi:hypothetical protein
MKKKNNAMHHGIFTLISHEKYIRITENINI